ncbi:MAG TPA: glycosyltransferase family 2 protein, partial [Flavitalea sp.]|nr:glycosyltransferase family 2 protein [Flavitalea sp.]
MLSIIIINYKTPKLTADCIRSVFAQRADIPFEIIIVDNASGDDSQNFITTSFPSVKWIQMTYNAGFARANNEGIRNSSGDSVLLLNSDTIIVDNAVNDCYKTFSASSYVACGVQLLNPNGSPQISGNYFMKGSLNNLLPLPVIGPFIKSIGNILKVKKPHVPDADRPVEVDWINGAYLMVKKSVISQAGLLDEDFFLYAEEAEWCYRLKKAGKLIIYGQFKVMHLQGESSSVAFTSNSQGYSDLYDKKGLQIMLSNFVRVRKQYGAGWFIFHLIIYTLNIPV